MATNTGGVLTGAAQEELHWWRMIRLQVKTTITTTSPILSKSQSQKPST